MSRAPEPGTAPKAAIVSANTAIERLLVVDGHRPGAVHRLVEDRTLAGGKPVNVARVLHQLGGVQPVLVGFAGGDTGALFRRLLAAEGLTGRWADTAGATRICETLVDLADPAGATVYNAAGPAITPAELAALDTLVEELTSTSAALVCTGSLPPGVPVTGYRDRLASARARGLVTVLDTHGPALAAGAAAAPTVVKVNRDELAAVGGDPESVVAGWRATGTECVIVTDGARPTEAYTPDGRWRVAAAPVDVVSAVGSGDAYLAGLLDSLLTRPDAGWPVHLRRAAACGAANATNIAPGLPPGLPLDELAARVAVTPH